MFSMFGKKQVGGAQKAWAYRIYSACDAAAVKDKDGKEDKKGRKRDARIAGCKALAMQRRMAKLSRLKSCSPCSVCFDP